MMLKRSTTESKPRATTRLVRAGLASLAVFGTAAALATGCLDRPVVPAEPKTSNLYVDQIIQTSVDKIDLLFMIDNSVSMADKQEILKAAVPKLLNRLVTPICVDAMGNPTTETPGNCKTGPEFSPIGDIHIGVVSSSLGGHGSTLPGCADGTAGNDNAHLIASVRNGKSWNSSGFLAWDASGKANTPPGESNAATLNAAFADMIGSVGETGCGFEAQLESWYRFLIDPEPPKTVTLTNSLTVRSSAIKVQGDKPVLDAAGRPVCDGCDDTLLAQRHAFLRADSLVAIVMLSDENDCSIRDDGVGWFVGSSARMPLATTACANNPNDPCCRSCASRETGGPPKGCGALTADANCSKTPATWDALHDSLNLRCYNQHQRFGFDLLYGTDRYVNALTQTTLRLQSNSNVFITNPLYDNTGSTKAPRSSSLVFLAGIVGVPWQDIADDASLKDPNSLNYLTAQQLSEMGRWDVLLGSPSASPPGPPKDPFMRETTEQRSGSNPIVNVPIVPATSKDPQANPINGHEQNIPSFDDLQYACIFKLGTPKTCDKGNGACDCSPDKNGDSGAVTAANSPLCQGGTSINQQVYAKAYPGARELQVLKDLGDNAIVASICPKITDPAKADYGYNPAVGAIIERLKEALKGKCLPRPVGTDPETGKVLCKVIEAQKKDCNCKAPGRGPADPQILPAVRDELKNKGNCDGPGQTGNACKDWCECEILQESGDDLTKCQTGAVPNAQGYCYVDKDPVQLSKCPANQQQLLRFVSASDNPTPASGAVAFIACLGSPVGSDAGQ